MTDPLPAGEIAGLRIDVRAGDLGAAGQDVTRLLDEVKRLREVFRIATSEPMAMGTMVATGEVLQAVDLAESARTLLKRIEWSGESDGEPSCPECGMNKPHG